MVAEWRVSVRREKGRKWELHDHRQCFSSCFLNFLCRTVNGTRKSEKDKTYLDRGEKVRLWVRFSGFTGKDNVGPISRCSVQYKQEWKKEERRHSRPEMGENLRAMAFPMPLLAPVTKRVLFLRERVAATAAMLLQKSESTLS